MPRVQGRLVILGRLWCPNGLDNEVFHTERRDRKDMVVVPTLGRDPADETAPYRSLVERVARLVDFFVGQFVPVAEVVEAASQGHGLGVVAADDANAVGLLEGPIEDVAEVVEGERGAAVGHG